MTADHLPHSVPSEKLTGIVIVTHNRLEQTVRCVDSIAAYAPEPHSILFVDNASTDGTVSYLQQRFGEDSVLVNRENEGFIRAANRGMVSVQGQYVLLLNNDTTVSPGWLAALQNAAERSSEVGIVSGKIVGPDGRVQLAGAYIAFDGSARMIGEGLPTDDPSLGVEREVCYVGGHCMLIKREVMDTIGLLDESYGFGYHEDTDYCYRAREAGFRVVYTPDCLVHHQLFGTPLPERQKIIEGNQHRFMERWGNKLFLRSFIGSRAELRADRGELPLGGGWFAAEQDYCCTGKDAWCHLKAPLAQPALLEIVAQAFHPNLVYEPLHLEVGIDGRWIGHAFFATPWEAKQLFFPIPATQEPFLRIELRVDRTWCPDELFADGKDPRAVGVAVKRISVGSLEEARSWAREGVPLEESMERLREHASFLDKALADKHEFYQRELEGREKLIARLQANLERYHATAPFRIYFSMKRLLSRRGETP